MLTSALCIRDCRNRVRIIGPVIMVSAGPPVPVPVKAQTLFSTRSLTESLRVPPLLIIDLEDQYIFPSMPCAIPKSESWPQLFSIFSDAKLYTGVSTEFQLASSALLTLNLLNSMHFPTIFAILCHQHVQIWRRLSAMKYVPDLTLIPRFRTCTDQMSRYTSSEA